MPGITVRQKLCKGVVIVGKEWGILATGQRLDGSQKVVQKYTILAGPVGQRCGKSVVFLATGLFSGGYTKVAQRCDDLPEEGG